MQVTKSDEHGSVPVTVFRIEGPFNSTEPLAGMVEEAISAGARSILLDLTDVTYLSSAGLHVLHTTYTLLRDSSESSEPVREGLREGSYYSPHLKLLNPSKMVAEVLHMSGYDMFLEAFTDKKEALDSF